MPINQNLRTSTCTLHPKTLTIDNIINSRNDKTLTKPTTTRHFHVPLFILVWALARISNIGDRHMFTQLTQIREWVQLVGECAPHEARLQSEQHLVTGEPQCSHLTLQIVVWCGGNRRLITPLRKLHAICESSGKNASQSHHRKCITIHP